MPTVATSTRLCATCNKYHLNAHPDSIPVLLRLGLSVKDVEHLLQAGDEAALPENQPTKFRQVQAPDIDNLRRLGFSDEQIETLTIEAQRLERESGNPSPMPSEETLRDATPDELAALQTFFDGLTSDDLPTQEQIRWAKYQAKNRERQQRFRNRHRPK